MKNYLGLISYQTLVSTDSEINFAGFRIFWYALDFLHSCFCCSEVSNNFKKNRMRLNKLLQNF